MPAEAAERRPKKRLKTTRVRNEGPVEVPSDDHDRAGEREGRTRPARVVDVSPDAQRVKETDNAPETNAEGKSKKRSRSPLKRVTRTLSPSPKLPPLTREELDLTEEEREHLEACESQRLELLEKATAYNKSKQAKANQDWKSFERRSIEVRFGVIKKNIEECQQAVREYATAVTNYLALTEKKRQSESAQKKIKEHRRRTVARICKGRLNMEVELHLETISGRIPNLVANSQVK